MQHQAVVRTHIDELLSDAQVYLDSDGMRAISRAVEMAVEFHTGQTRKFDGSPYVLHPLRIARTILTWGLRDPISICTALLHDTIEDAPPQLCAEDRIKEWNPEVAELVLALTKVRKSSGGGDLTATYERIVSAAARDIRVLLIKSFDVLDNSETFGFVHKPAKARTKAAIGLLYVGTARKLGISALADSLTQNLVPFLMPKQYREFLSDLKNRQSEDSALLSKVVAHLEGIGELEDVQVQLVPKDIADYFCLTETPGSGRLMGVDEIPSHRLEFIVENEARAWAVLGLVHQQFQPVRRRVRDYLNVPKANGFRALTTRVFISSVTVSVHIVCREDFDSNRYGVLAQWEHRASRVTQFADLLEIVGSSSPGRSEVHAIGLRDQLDVYSKSGQHLTFPHGATVIDFAYGLSAREGDHCIGAMVDGKYCPPEHPLQDGDIIELVTNDRSRPRRAWLREVTTPRARLLIREALKRTTEYYGVVRSRGKQHFEITNLDSDELHFATCCIPTPNEAIVGRKTRDGGWRIHRAHCKAGQGWIKGKWKKCPKRITFAVQLLLSHKSGTLRSLLDLFAEAGVNLTDLVTTPHRKKTQYYMEFLADGSMKEVCEALEGLRDAEHVIRILHYRFYAKQRVLKRLHGAS